MNKVFEIFRRIKKQLLIVNCSLLIVPLAHAARYDAFTSEVSRGLDHVSIDSSGEASAGELGRTVYTSKVESDMDVFIPTTAYIRLGAGANVWVGGPGFEVDGGADIDYDWGLVQNFAFGWNLSSVFRTELGWTHSDMRFADATATVDTGRLTLFIDLARRNRMYGDVMYRRRLVPFIGFGGGAGYADFEDLLGIKQGKSGLVYGGHASLGVTFAFSDTNAVDLMINYEMMFADNYVGWHENTKQFGNASISLSWRSGF